MAGSVCSVDERGTRPIYATSWWTYAQVDRVARMWEWLNQGKERDREFRAIVGSVVPRVWRVPITRYPENNAEGYCDRSSRPRRSLWTRSDYRTDYRRLLVLTFTTLRAPTHKHVSRLPGSQATVGQEDGPIAPNPAGKMTVQGHTRRPPGAVWDVDIKQQISVSYCR